MEVAVEKRGLLLKAKSSGTWKPKHCVLKNTIFCYYATPQSLKPNWEDKFTKTTELQRVSTQEFILKFPSKTLHFKAQSEQDCNSWFLVLQQVSHQEGGGYLSPMGKRHARLSIGVHRVNLDSVTTYGGLQSYADAIRRSTVGYVSMSSQPKEEEDYGALPALNGPIKRSTTSPKLGYSMISKKDQLQIEQVLTNEEEEAIYVELPAPNVTTSREEPVYTDLPIHTVKHNEEYGVMPVFREAPTQKREVVEDPYGALPVLGR